MININKHVLKLSGLMAAFLFTLLTPGLSQAVTAGYDFFETSPSTFFIGGNQVIPFTGVPLGLCSAGSCGTPTLDGINVGSTDTIVQRLNDVTTDSGVTGLAIQALQLVSTTQLDFSLFGGSGLGWLYVTLAGNQSGLTGVPTASGLNPNTMQIEGATTGSGTFSSYLDFNVDFFQSPNSDGSGGTLVNNLFGSSDPVEIKLGAHNVAWSSTLPAPAGSSNCPIGSVVVGPRECHGVDGVTVNGVLVDFHPAPSKEFPVPEPTTLALFSVGLGLFGYSRRKIAFRSNMIPA